MEMANNHRKLRLMLGHSYMDYEYRYSLQTLKDNISLFTPEVLDKINQIVVNYGHEVIGKKPDEDLRASCDSFVVETDVHFPTDINLLFDAMRKIIVLIMSLCDDLGLPGWRKGTYNIKKVKRYFRKAQQLRRSTSKDPEKKSKREQLIINAHLAYLELAMSLIERVRETIALELGLKVCVVKDQFGFILYHRVMQKETDDQIAVPIIIETKERFKELNSCSFDKGFHSPYNQKELAEILDKVILPRKGKLSGINKEIENPEKFKEARLKHSAVESSINALENHGLDCCLDHGIHGFKRYVGLAVLSRNIQIIGHILQQKQLKRLQKLENKQQIKLRAAL